MVASSASIAVIGWPMTSGMPIRLTMLAKKPRTTRRVPSVAVIPATEGRTTARRRSALSQRRVRPRDVTGLDPRLGIESARAPSVRIRLRLSRTCRCLAPPRGSAHRPPRPCGHRRPGARPCTRHCCGSAAPRGRREPVLEVLAGVAEVDAEGLQAAARAGIRRIGVQGARWRRRG